jgi:ABC-type nitrate/sulfonate/bicarbonate transport system permease component
MGMTWLQRARYLVLPTLLPYFITGVRLSATIALILGISAELIIGTDGLGQSVAQAQLNGAPVAMYALIVTAGVLGIIINTGAKIAERKALFWHESVRAEVPA